MNMQIFNSDATADALIGQGLSTKTVVCYVSVLERANRICLERGWSLADLTATQTRELSEAWPLARSSRAQLRSALIRFWEAHGRLDGPARAIRTPSHPEMRCRALSEPEAQIFEQAARRRRDHKGLVVLLGLYTALRRAEMAALRWDDVDAEGWVTIVGKGDKTASIPIHPIALKAFRAEERRRRRRSPWVFPGRWDGHANPTTIWLWCRDVARDAGLGEIATHVLRHTCLATANDATGDLRATMALARHSRPETTAGYTRTKKRRLESVVMSIVYDGQEVAS